MYGTDTRAATVSNDNTVICNNNPGVSSSRIFSNNILIMIIL